VINGMVSTASASNSVTQNVRVADNFFHTTIAGNTHPQSRRDDSALWLHLHLPHLPLEVLTRGLNSHEACVLVSGEERHRKVLLANRQAVALGIRAGMQSSAAQVLGQVRVLERNERAEQQALDKLGLWAMQITPMVSRVEPDGLLLEIKGSLKLFGGLEGLLARLRRGLKQLGYRTNYATAPTPLGATLLARANSQRLICDQHQLQLALGALPIEVLQLEAKQHAALVAFGAKRLSDCRRLPRDGLARRLSPAFVDMLDRLFGQIPDPRCALKIPRSFDAELELPWEVDNARALTTAGERLLQELCGYLTANAAQTRHLRWRLLGRDNQIEYFDIKLTRVGRDERHMGLLLRESLARKTLHVPVKGIGLNVSGLTFSTTPATHDLFMQTKNQGGEDEAYAAFVDRLRARCGEQALRRLGIRSAHNPERAWCWQRPVEVSQRRRKGLTHVEERRRQRPLWLLKHAVKLNEEQGQPLFGGRLALTPERERIVNGWWEEAEVARDYFTATTEGGARLWIYRELSGPGHWYLQGIFE
jgi:protein ImuB